jgi:Asp-tRNA(Asn)/Glu-tRNA(Gln) amidotransferase C subunit
LENQLEMKLVKKTARLKLSEQARDIINRFEILEKYIEQLLQKTNQNFTKLIRNNKQ